MSDKESSNDVLVKFSDVTKQYGDLVVLDKLGGASWQKRKSKLKAQILEVADSLIKTAAVRQLKHVKPIELPEPDWQKFCSKFNYLETDDQNSAIDAIIDDFESGIPMDRLICGDVGFGKTEIAMRAAYIVAMSGMQVALICPSSLRLKNNGLRSFFVFDIRCIWFAVT